MSNFYDDWLKYWDDENEERSKARTSLNEEDLEWMKTKQDWRAALLCSRENGFITSGVTMLGDIPGGWRTGKHSHGEEAMYIVQGNGFSVVDGLRYDWESGSCLFMPYGSVHQHFNPGKDTVRYFSAMALPLERFAGVAMVTQYDETGEIAMGDLEGIKAAESDIHPEYGRIVLKQKDAPVVQAKEFGAYLSKREDEYIKTTAKEMRTPGAAGHRSRFITLMDNPQNGFKAREVHITTILCDAPGLHSGKHSHMEAVLYVLQGEGYSVVDGQRIPWKKGSVFQVQGPRTVHQHFNTGQVESQHLRIHYGLRSNFFQPIAKRTFPYRYYEYSSY